MNRYKVAHARNCTHETVGVAGLSLAVGSRWQLAGAQDAWRRDEHLVMHRQVVLAWLLPCLPPVLELATSIRFVLDSGHMVQF